MEAEDVFDGPSKCPDEETFGDLVMEDARSKSIPRDTKPVLTDEVNHKQLSVFRILGGLLFRFVDLGYWHNESELRLYDGSSLVFRGGKLFRTPAEYLTKHYLKIEGEDRVRVLAFGKEKI